MNQADGIRDFLTDLEDPCTKISFYDHKLEKVVQWKGEQSKIELSSNRYSPPFLELLESFYDDRKLKGNASTKQILLIDVPVSISHKVREAIEFLENKTKWNVILLCLPYYCPITIRLPINRIVPSWRNYQSIQRNVKNLILNLDFNKFEFLKYTSFSNKTVHILIGYISNNAMKNLILMLKHNIQKDTITKFIIYFPDWVLTEEKLPKYYLEQNGLEAFISIVCIDLLKFSTQIDFFFTESYDVKIRLLKRHIRNATFVNYFFELEGKI